MAEEDALPFDPRALPHAPMFPGGSPTYLTGEEALRVSSFSSASPTLTISARVLGPDNKIRPVQFQQAGNNTRAVSVGTIQSLAEGWLLGITIRYAAGGAAALNTYVLVELVRGLGASAIVVQTLAAGFLSPNMPFHWPGGPSLLPLDGPGHLRSITGTTPAATSEISETVPTGARWELLTFSYTFVTSAVVSNRRTTVIIDDGATTFWSSAAQAVQAASLTVKYWRAQGLVAPYADSDGAQIMPIPFNLKLGAGFRLRTSTAGFGAADQYSAVQYLVREWMTGE